MKENILTYINKLKEFWGARSSIQKIGIIGAAIVLIISILAGSLLSKPNLVPLYSNLSPQETGQIKATLDGRGISNQISNNGTTIHVPANVVDSLKVELAAEGIPDSGKIDYTFFGENAGWGTTSEEFNILKVEAMQTELEGLISIVDGITNAKVMITLPKDSVWANEQTQEASVSIVLQTSQGYKFTQDQINALYHLVSKSVPNLPVENIVITNQLFEYFNPKSTDSQSTYSLFEQQYQIKQEIEHDIQRQVQQMLGMMMGRENVVVSVTADLDFTKEKSEASIVEAVDKDNIEGIAVSVERITDTYSGATGTNGGPAEPNGDDTTYQEANNQGIGESERIEERINYEFNRIRKEIVESPYKVRDLGIQVMVEPPEGQETLPIERINDIEQILSTIVRTSISKDGDGRRLSDEELASKVFVSVQPFNGKIKFDEQQPLVETPWWVYVAGLLALIIIVLLLFFLVRKRQSSQEVDDEPFNQDIPATEVPEIERDPETEADTRKKQLERMAKNKPEDFAKLLRSWLAED